MYTGMVLFFVPFSWLVGMNLFKGTYSRLGDCLFKKILLRELILISYRMSAKIYKTILEKD